VPRLIWTPAALADVQRLYRFLAPKNPDAARRAVKAIRAGVKILAQQPYAGRMAQGMEATREWLIGFGNSGYVALYRIEDDMISILAVRHQKELGWQE